MGGHPARVGRDGGGGHGRVQARRPGVRRADEDVGGVDNPALATQAASTTQSHIYPMSSMELGHWCLYTRASPRLPRRAPRPTPPRRETLERQLERARNV